MNEDEANNVMRILITSFDGPGKQPDWGDAATMPAWLAALTPYSLADAQVTLAELFDEWWERRQRGDVIYFPRLVDFVTTLRTVATRSEQEAYQRDALTAAIRCDGSRFIENAPDARGVRPFPSKGDGMVACPTCSPSMHNRQLGGNQHEPTPRGEQAAPAPCRPDADEFNGPTLAGRGEIARAKAMLVPSDTRAPAPRVFRSLRELDEPEADTSRQPGDASLRCPWCGGSVTRTKLAQWWRCENGEMATMRQILAGIGGGR